MFDFKTKDNITAKAAQLGGELPWSDDLSPLAAPLVTADGLRMKNSITVHPMEGFDGLDASSGALDGAPSELTFRRYEKFASSGAGLIWFEATTVCRESRTSQRQLWITRDNVGEFARLREAIRKTAPDVPVIMQLTHSGRYSKPNGYPSPVIAYHNPVLNTSFNIDPDYPVVSDAYLDTLAEKYADAAELAQKAGFDGVDVKACHRYLMSELLSAYERKGRYGGSYENRTRLFIDSIRAVRERCPGLHICTRFSAYDGIEYPYGFGVDRDDYRKPDFTEPKRLLADINALGVSLVNLTMGTPYYNPHVNRPYDKGGYEPPEHPLAGVLRMINGGAELSAAFPTMTFIGTGYSYLRGFAPNVAAGALASGRIGAVGFGRMAFAYPAFARDMIAGGFDPKKTCITCGRCTELMRANMTTGCPVRDPYYTELYKKLSETRK